MNRDDIFRMAREAGLCDEEGRDSDSIVITDYLEHFANLVAAVEREKLKHELLTLEKWKGMALAKDGDGRTVQELQREAREAEREACAVVVEQAGMDGYGTLAAALLVRERGAP